MSPCVWCVGGSFRCRSAPDWWRHVAGAEVQAHQHAGHDREEDRGGRVAGGGHAEGRGGRRHRKQAVEVSAPRGRVPSGGDERQAKADLDRAQRRRQNQPGDLEVQDSRRQEHHHPQQHGDRAVGRQAHLSA